MGKCSWTWSGNGGSTALPEYWSEYINVGNMAMRTFSSQYEGGHWIDGETRNRIQGGRFWIDTEWNKIWVQWIPREWIDYNDPQFRIRFHFLSEDSTSNKKIKMQVFMRGMRYTDTFKNSFSYGSPVDILLFGQGDKDHMGKVDGGTIETSVLLPLANINFLPGTSFGKNILLDWKFFRQSGSGDITNGRIYMMGVDIQYKTDWNNISQWPT